MRAVCLFLLAFFVLIGLSINDDLLLSDCCPQKTVGGVLYTQIPGNTEGYRCKEECVYEQVGKQGSRFCFSAGDQQVECMGSETRFAIIPLTYSEKEGGIVDWITFNTDIGNVHCTVGAAFNVSAPEDISCSLEEDSSSTSAPALLPGNQIVDETASFVVSEDEKGFEWFIIHMDKATFHCRRFKPPAIGTICHLGPAFDNGMVYVENSFADISHMDDCRQKCDNTPDCQFWTFSDINEKPTPYGRNHDGISECGIRNYGASTLINTADGQYCGKKNEGPENIKSGMVYVVHAAIRYSDWDCNNLCKNLGPAGVPCVSWTFSYRTKQCVINNFEPQRLINVCPPGKKCSYVVSGPGP